MEIKNKNKYELNWSEDKFFTVDPYVKFHIVCENFTSKFYSDSKFDFTYAKVTDIQQDVKIDLTEIGVPEFF